MATGVGEFDRVLGGGIVPGALILIGGDPGIGKSTMLLVSSRRVSQAYGTVLYVSGEESAVQTKMRAERLNKLSDTLLIMTETNLEEIITAANRLKPALMIIDSIQTMFSAEIPSAPGSGASARIHRKITTFGKGKRYSNWNYWTCNQGRKYCWATYFRTYGRCSTLF